MVSCVMIYEQTIESTADKGIEEVFREIETQFARYDHHARKREWLARMETRMVG